MKTIGIRAKFLSAVLIYFIVLLSFFLFRYARSAEQWVAHPANRNLFTDGLPASGGTVLSADGATLLAFGENGRFAYAQDTALRRATLHAVGDPGGNINTGVRRTRKADLMGYDVINGVFDASGGGSTVTLTLDAAANLAALGALGGRRGAVGVYNYQTGEILAMVSTPTFDPHNIPDLTAAAYEGVYLNRLTGSTFTPGSIFKVVTAAAALEHIPDIQTRQFTCDAGVYIDGSRVRCRVRHGTLDFNAALAASCNAAFGLIAHELGPARMAAAAEAAGVGDSFNISGVSTARGRFDVENISGFDLAWAGIGQHTTLVNPMQFMIYMGAIANGGQAATPYYVDSVRTAHGLPRYRRRRGTERRMLSPEIASELKAMMRYNTVSAYGDNHLPGLQMGGKTGTAQVGGDNTHAWFAGFLDDPGHPLAFVVIVEHGGTGYSAALPVVRAVVRSLTGG